MEAVCSRQRIPSRTDVRVLWRRSVSPPCFAVDGGAATCCRDYDGDLGNEAEGDDWRRARVAKCSVRLSLVYLFNTINSGDTDERRSGESHEGEASGREDEGRVRM